MKRLGVTFGLALVLSAVIGSSARVHAQADAIMCRIRGTVVDQDGQPLRDVMIEVLHTKSGRKFNLKTDKKGGFVRVGMAEGDYTLTFTKDGYRVAKTKVWISLGELSEVPTVTMQAQAADAAQASPTTGAPGATPPAAAPAVEMEAEQLAAVKSSFASALEAEKAGRSEEAEALYKEILAKAPKLAEAHYNLGRIYRQRQSWPEAEAELRQSIALQADRSDSYLALAGVLQSAGRRDEAAQLLRDAAARFGQDAAFQFALGVRNFNDGENDAAQAAFKKARELDPVNPEPIYYLGVIAVGQNRLADAVPILESYVAAAGQDPKNLALAKDILKAVKSPPKK